MPAHISRIQIKNFRNFAEVDIGPLPPAVVVIGENRSGKSNLLRALQLVLDPTLPDAQRYLQREDFWDGAPNPLGGDEIEVVVELEDIEGDDVAMAALADATVGEEPLIARLGYRYRPRSGLEGEQRATGRSGYEFITWQGLDEAKRITSEVRRWVALQVLPALRDAEADLQSWRRSPLRPLIERIDLSTDALRELQEKVDAVRSELADEPAVRDLNQSLINRILEMVGDHFAVETDLSIAATRSDQLLRAIRLFAESPIARRIGDTSLGTSNLIYMALLLEQARVRLDAEEVATTILAVDEPEAHLHPQVQRVLFRYLLGSGTPLFVTTHSPHIASVTPLPSIVLLRSTAGSTAPATARRANLTEAQIIDLHRYLDVTRAEMLFARAVLLVEGAAELFIVPAIAHLMDLDLEAMGITVTAVNGTDFVPYLRLLGRAGFDVPHAVVTDGDPAANGRAGVRRGRRALELAREVEPPDEDTGELDEWLQTQGIFVGERTLELDLLRAYPAAFSAALVELSSGDRARTRAAEESEAALAGDPEAQAGTLNRIEAIGKGRFAQRLSSLIDGPDGPPYIAGAIRYLTERLRRDAGG